MLMFLIFPSFFILLILAVCKIYSKRSKSGKNVCVVVLGDIGRSPRMQYHAISFAKEGFTVDIIGYPGSLPKKEIRENARIQIHYLRPPPELQNRLPLVLCYVAKVIWQTVNLLWSLPYKRVPDLLLMQNPPAIPTSPVCWFYCALMGTQFVIDWHNYAYSLMAFSLKENHILVRVAKIIEITFGRMASSNFCVTKAMKEDLQNTFAILLVQ